MRNLNLRDESLDVVYRNSNGHYYADALAEIRHFMRDWRDGTRHDIDHRLLDLIWATHVALDTNEPFWLISGFRSRRSNELLRKRSKGVARHSLHLTGQANDLRLTGRSVSQIARAAARVARSSDRGGVGRYSESNFVHIDCGRVRSWGA